MFFKPREQKQKTIESFSHIFQQKQGSYFWIHQKKKDSKKRNRVQNMKQKKREFFKMRNHFSRQKKRPNMEK